MNFFFLKKNFFSIFFWIFLCHFVSSFISYSIFSYIIILIYTLFLLFQNSLFSQYKKWKIEKIEFFCAYCVHIKKFLGDNSLMLCCSPKNFSWFFETFLVLKILAKKNIFRKKGSTTEISGEKKKWKMADFRRSAGIWIQYLGGPFLSIRGNFCKKNYMIWALNAFCVYQNFHSIILT